MSKSIKCIPVLWVTGLVLATMLLPGCKNPNEVQLRDEDPDKANLVEVTDVGSTEVPSVDSSATLPNDRRRFQGFIEITRLKYDGLGLRDTSAAFSTVLFQNLAVPIKATNGDTLGYQGIDLGVVSIAYNASPVLMTKLNRFVGRDKPAGFVYAKDMTQSYLPNTDYSWKARGSGNDSFSVSIRTPGALAVLYPRGGSVIPKNKDLEFRWLGRDGELSIVLSYVADLATKKIKPLYVIRPIVGRGRAVVGASVLQTLPSNRMYLLTFALVNKAEKISVGRYSGKVLVQAADVYNSFVEFR